MEPLKEMFNTAYYRQLAAAVKQAYPAFSSAEFLQAATAGLSPLSLNQRLRHTSVTIRPFLPDDFEEALQVLKKVAEKMPAGYTALVYPDFTALYGLEHWDLSLRALKYFTVFGSSEFAVREFLRRDFSRTIAQMEKWSADKNPHVRRLSSEGSRPRLPWSFKLDAVVDDPSLTKQILINLREDPELYVRKSVANHLNDISKDHPAYMLRLVSSWNSSIPETAWIIKHASRTLIKKGDPGSLAVFAFEKNPRLTVRNLKVSRQIRLGERLNLDLEIISGKKSPQKLVVDYRIHYVKKGGGLSAKVFKLKEFVLAPGETRRLSARQLIRDFTTRKHFAGRHLLEIQVNGRILASAHFDLKL